MEIFHSLQEKHKGTKHGLPIPTMTKEEFDNYAGEDGIVTWPEYKGLGFGGLIICLIIKC